MIVSVTYILVHQARLTDTAVAEDNNLFERDMLDMYSQRRNSRAGDAVYLQKHLLPRRHVEVVKPGSLAVLSRLFGESCRG